MSEINNCKDLETSCCNPSCKPCVQVNVNPCCGSSEAPQYSGRTMLEENLIIYVRKDGDDANDGLTDSPEGAKLTIGAALRSLLRFDAQGYAMTVMIHAGEYNEAVSIGGAYNSIGFSSLTVQAFEGEAVSVVYDGAGNTIGIGFVNRINLIGLTVINTRSAGDARCISVNSYGYCICKNCKFVAAGTNYCVIYAHTLSYLEFNTYNTFSVKNANNVFECYNNAVMQINGTIHNEGVSASYYVVASAGGMVHLAGTPTFTGSVSGKSYAVNTNSTIVRNGITLPGTAAGSYNDGTGVVA